ncbi:MAG TPA: hypothetical protein PLL18_08595, partial [Flavobacteriales bacterium]|nr:hypothetical protein [Flavobacteriales bacterium]
TEPAGTSLPQASPELNQALLLRVWDEYAKLLKRQNKVSMHATLMANRPEITGPQEVTFTIVNTVQENYMRDEKPALLGHLRQQLGSPALNLIVV